MTARLTCLAAVVIVALVLPGCGSMWQNYNEEFKHSGVSGDPAAPDWVKGRMPNTPGEVYFVGRGVGYNTFDERGAYDEAVNHCLQQLGKQLGTRVMSRVVDVDSVTGRRFYPGTSKYGFTPRVEQVLTQEIQMATRTLAGDLVDRGSYFEQWYLEQEPEVKCGVNGQRMKRYKCWVLMSISQARLDARVKLVSDEVRIRAAASGRNPGILFVVDDKN